MPLAVDDARAVLARTPITLSTWLQGLPEAWVTADEGEGTFSPLEVVAHLIQGEADDWIPRLRIIIEEGEGRTFTPFDRFAHRQMMSGRSLGELLDEFASLRRASLQALDELMGDATRLDRTGVHPAFGRVTARQHLAAWVVHDLSHLAQIARVMAHRYSDDVGPFRAYLPILDARRRGGGA